MLHADAKFWAAKGVVFQLRHVNAAAHRKQESSPLDPRSLREQVKLSRKHLKLIGNQYDPVKQSHIISIRQSSGMDWDYYKTNAFSYKFSSQRTSQNTSSREKISKLYFQTCDVTWTCQGGLIFLRAVGSRCPQDVEKTCFRDLQCPRIMSGYLEEASHTWHLKVCRCRFRQA